MKLTYFIVLFVLSVTVTTASASIRQRKDKLPDTMKVTVSRFTILPLLQAGVLVGATADIFPSKQRGLFGVGGRLEYGLTPTIRFDAGIDWIYGMFVEGIGLDQGRARSVSIGTIVMHQPEKRSSLYIRGEIGKALLGTDKSRDYTRRDAVYYRIGIGQSYFFSKTRSTRVEFFYRIIDVTTGDKYPYVGVANHNITYLGLMFTLGFGL